MTRALVLSGGGSVGIAWQTGLAAGLARQGVDLAAADFIVGTSAGSAVGAHLAAGVDLEARLAGYEARAARGEEREPSPGNGTPASARSPISPERMAKLIEVMAKAQSGVDEDAGRAEIGRFALESEALDEDVFVAGFRELADLAWPDRYACTAVDAETGAFVVWDAKSGAPLDRAVASSCCVPGIFSPVTVNGRRYIDGGMRSGTNADLAKGYDKVLLVTLMDPDRMAAAAPADPRMARYRERIQRELSTLEESGGTVRTIGPDNGAAAVIGMNLMDARLAPAAAREGLRQGQAVAEELRTFWD